MLPWIPLDTANIPGGGELKLKRRGTEFAITLGANTLMSSRFSGSEIALADLACARVGQRKTCRVLIGGFGMGFTLRAALAVLGADARVVVAELIPQIIAWARGPMAELSAACLADPRVTLREGDVWGVIASAQGSFDAILLDVDNGPDGLTMEANDRLYGSEGLHAARRALRPRGILAIWSAAPNPPFAQRLARAGFKVEEVKARAHGGGGARHIIWLAAKP